MNKAETEHILEEILYRRKGVKDGTALPYVDEVCRSVAKSVDYAPDLKGISPEAIRAAAEMIPMNIEYKTVMQYLREMFAVQKRMAMIKEPSQGGFTPVRPEIENELTNWGFLLRCRDAWLRDGDLGSISDLTVTYAARWILSDIHFWLSSEDVRWCEDVARADKALCHESADRIELAYKRSYEEAVVSLAMRRIDERVSGQSGSINALLDTKRREYEDYFIKTRGEKPDWTVSDKRKPVRCSAFAKNSRLIP